MERAGLLQLLLYRHVRRTGFRLLCLPTAILVVGIVTITVAAVRSCGRGRATIAATGVQWSSLGPAAAPPAAAVHHHCCYTTTANRRCRMDDARARRGRF